jgi:hypothetical protein
MQKMKKHSGLLCCVAALLFVISCSSHRTTAHSGYNSHVHLGHSTPIAYTSDHGSIEVLALQAIIIAAVLVVPPIIDAVGELLDDVFVAIGLKEREPISARYLTAPTNRN